MENLLRNTDSTSITTMFPDSRPTYFSPQGTSRTLDHGVGRRLQIIPAGPQPLRTGGDTS